MITCAEPMALLSFSTQFLGILFALPTFQECSRTHPNYPELRFNIANNR
jgi:hypothetical protein